jgi:hypothetical protein
MNNSDTDQIISNLNTRQATRAKTLLDLRKDFDKGGEPLIALLVSERGRPIRERLAEMCPRLPQSTADHWRALMPMSFGDIVKHAAED